MLLILIGLFGYRFSTCAAPGDEHWDSAFGVPGADGSVWAITFHGEDVYVGGSFTQIGGVSVNNIARWDGTNWSALGTGLTGGLQPEIHSLVFIGDNLYAGGFFTHAGSVSSQGVAKWDGTNWIGLAGGVSGAVRALAVSQGKLIAGGTFSAAGGVAAVNVASWDGTNWAPIGTGISGQAVDSLAATETTLYAGGRFRIGAGINATNIAKWNGTSWAGLAEGIRDFDQRGGGGGIVRTFTFLGSDLIAAGNFRLAGAMPAANVARWNGFEWSPLGSGIDHLGDVYTLRTSGNALYAAGLFSSASGTSTLGIAKWEDSVWSALGSGITSGGGTGVGVGLAVSGSELYLGGFFDHTGGKPANNIALWHIPHALDIRRSAGELVLSWPATGSNFVLEASSGMGQSNWVQVAQTPVRVGDQLVVTNQASYANEFYRLRRR